MTDGVRPISLCFQSPLSNINQAVSLFAIVANRSTSVTTETNDRTIGDIVTPKMISTDTAKHIPLRISVKQSIPHLGLYSGYSNFPMRCRIYA